MRISLLYPEEYKRDDKDSLGDSEFVAALGINHMIPLNDQSNYGTSVLDICKYFTNNPKVLSYRLDIMDDILANPKIYDLFHDLIPMIRDMDEIGKVKGTSDGEIETDILSIKLVELYVKAIDVLYEGFGDTVPKSEGILNLKEFITQKYESEEYKNLKAETEKLYSQISHIKSITVGINVNGLLQATEAGILSVNTKVVKEGNIIDKLKRKNEDNSYCTMSGFLSVSKVIGAADRDKLNASLNYSLNVIFKKTIRSWVPIIEKFFMRNTEFLRLLLEDLRVMIAGAKFAKQMKEKGFSMCHPVIREKEEKKCILKGVYNPMVVLRCGQDSPVVSNDVEFDAEGMFYLITGPNHGGKSIFLYSVGIVQALAQLGFFVPAESAEVSPVDNIFTHFPASDENNYGKGRLESECDRLSQILKRLDEHSLLLMDEALSSTSVSEAEYILMEVLMGIGVIGCRGLFVTHIHDLPMKVDEMNSHPDNKGKIDNLCAQMKNREDGIRSYKIERAVPDGLSYAKDIAKKYGLELETILTKQPMQ